MSTDAINRIEMIRGQKLSEEEATRLRGVGEALNLRDDDALWPLLAALEYQRVFYEALPDKIAGASAEIQQGIAAAAEKESVVAQARLTESVVEQAKRLSVKIQYATLLPIAMAALICLLAYGSLLLWAGFQIGSGQAQPLALWLQMPSGLLMGGLCLGTRLLCGVVTARSFVGEEKGWYRSALVATVFLLTGAVSFCLGV
jgi:hypothetical protein